MNNEVRTERKFDLEERLIDFAVLISVLSDQLPNNCVGIYNAGQIIDQVGSDYMILIRPPQQKMNVIN